MWIRDFVLTSLSFCRFLRFFYRFLFRPLFICLCVFISSHTFYVNALDNALMAQEMYHLPDNYEMRLPEKMANTPGKWSFTPGKMRYFAQNTPGKPWKNMVALEYEPCIYLNGRCEFWVLNLMKHFRNTKIPSNVQPSKRYSWHLVSDNRSR